MAVKLFEEETNDMFYSTFVDIVTAYAKQVCVSIQTDSLD